MKKKLEGKKSLILTAIIGLCVWASGCGGGTADLKAAEGIETYEILTDEIYERTQQWLNEDGTMSEENAELASREVYAWAQELEADGAIDGASRNEESQIVAFFLNNGRDYLFMPAIEGTSSGSDKFSVVAVTMLSGLEDSVISGISKTSSEDAADYILENVPECRAWESIQNVTAQELKKDLGNLDGVRAIFWRGHGGVYTDREGKVQTVFSLRETVTEEKDDLYADDLDVGGDVPLTMDVATNWEGAKRHGGTYRYVVLGSFFEEYMDQVDGGLFYAGTCCSACDGGALAQIVCDKGMEAYMGANGNIFTIYSDQMMQLVAEYLTEKDVHGRYLTIQDAFEKARRDAGEADYAGIQMLLAQDLSRDPFRLVPDESYVHVEMRALKSEWSELEDGTITLTAADGTETALNYKLVNMVAKRFMGDVDPGEYVLNADFKGYLPYEETITVPKGKSEWKHEITLEPGPYALYAELLEEYEEKYGEAHVVTMSDDYPLKFVAGVGFVQLIDFDRDGIEELFLVRGKTMTNTSYNGTVSRYPEYIVEIWSFRDGKIQKAYSGDVMFASDVSRSVVFIERTEATYYLNGMIGYETDCEYWGLENGRFETVRSERNALDSAVPEYYIDGNSVSQSEWSSSVQNWRGVETRYHLLGENLSDILQMTSKTRDILGME